MNKNKQFKKALSCSLAIVMPAVTYAPMVVQASSTRVVVGGEKATRAEQESQTRYDILLTHLRNVVDSTYNSVNLNLLSDTEDKNEITQIYNDIMKDIKKSEINTMSGYRKLSRQCDKKIDELLALYKDACNNESKTPQYIRYTDMVVYKYEEDNFL